MLVRVPVSLNAVADELDALTNEMTAFVNRRTGEITSVSDDDAALAEEAGEDEYLPEWQRKMLPGLREIVFGEDWVRLPTKFDIHEWEIMRKFADSLHDDPLTNRLHAAIRGKGAFRTFRKAVEDAGVLDDWYRFKRAKLREIARGSLDHHGIAYV